MDRVWMQPEPGENACQCKYGSEADWCRKAWKCEERIVLTPEEYAALETQLAELKSACGLKDGGLTLACAELDRKCNRCRRAEDDGETCFKALTCSTGIAHRAVYAALSLTPESVKREAEDARIGRAAEEWRKVQVPIINKAHGEFGKGYLTALEALSTVIAQAREGEKK